MESGEHEQVKSESKDSWHPGWAPNVEDNNSVNVKVEPGQDHSNIKSEIDPNAQIPEELLKREAIDFGDSENEDENAVPLEIELFEAEYYGEEEVLNTYDKD